MSTNAANRERIQWYQQHGICYMCGQADAVRRGLCEKCLEKRLETERKFRETHRGQYNNRSKEWREKNKAAGMCPYCGKNPPEPGRTRCRQCAEAGAARNKRNYRRKREKMAAGPCRWCGRPSVPGYQHCPEHLETLRANIAKARAQKRQGGDRDGQH